VLPVRLAPSPVPVGICTVISPPASQRIQEPMGKPRLCSFYVCSHWRSRAQSQAHRCAPQRRPVSGGTLVRQRRNRPRSSAITRILRMLQQNSDCHWQIRPLLDFPKGPDLYEDRSRLRLDKVSLTKIEVRLVQISRASRAWQKVLHVRRAMILNIIPPSASDLQTIIQMNPRRKSNVPIQHLEAAVYDKQGKASPPLPRMFQR